MQISVLLPLPLPYHLEIRSIHIDLLAWLDQSRVGPTRNARFQLQDETEDFCRRLCLEEGQLIPLK